MAEASTKVETLKLYDKLCKLASVLRAVPCLEGRDGEGKEGGRREAKVYICRGEKGRKEVLDCDGEVGLANFIAEYCIPDNAIIGRDFIIRCSLWQ